MSSTRAAQSGGAREADGFAAGAAEAGARAIAEAARERERERVRGQARARGCEARREREPAVALTGGGGRDVALALLVGLDERGQRFVVNDVAAFGSARRVLLKASIV